MKQRRAVERGLVAVSLGIALGLAACGGESEFATVEEPRLDAGASGLSAFGGASFGAAGSAASGAGGANQGGASLGGGAGGALVEPPAEQVCSRGGPSVLEFDAADCSSRRVDPCELPGDVFAEPPSDKTVLESRLFNVVRGCAPGAIDLSMRLDLVAGCPVRFETNYAFSNTAWACLRAKLESSRFSCGESLSCVHTSRYFL